VITIIHGIRHLSWQLLLEAFFMSWFSVVLDDLDDVLNADIVLKCALRCSEYKQVFGVALTIKGIMTRSFSDHPRYLELRSALEAEKNHKAAKSKTSFLILPPEIRNIIYEYVFGTGPAGAEVVHSRASDNLDFLRTCRQVRNEAYAIAFSSTSFLSSTMKDVKRLIPRLPQHEFSAIKSIGIANSNLDPLKLLVTYIRLAPRLKSL